MEFPVVPLNYHTNGEIVMAEIQKRLKVCQERHLCSTNSIPYLPTRVIDVGSATSKQPLHLRVSQKDEKAHYAALSYCWGGKQRVTTTLATIDAYMKRLPASTLPKTIQDAIKVTQKLGIRYLWVDAFCIVQDSPKDLAKEIDAMGTIYNQATITIAAIGAASVEDGFLQCFSTERSGSLAFQLPKGLVTSVTVIEKRPEWAGGPLDKRAWGFQEFHLSARLLLYGSNGDLRWHCEHDRFARLFDKGPSLKRGRKHTYLKMGDRSNRPQSSPVRPWSDLVEEFSQRILTYAEDRLPALAGIARHMSGILQDDYLAGIWRSDLVAQLSWSILPDTPGYFQPCPTAPSWSWASVNRPIQFNECFGEPEAQAISCTVDPIDKEAPFGKVREGVLKIRAPVLSMNAIPWDERKWGFIVDNPGQGILRQAKEVELLRLGLTGSIFRRVGSRQVTFHGIIITCLGDGKYKRIGSFWYEGDTFKVDIFEGDYIKNSHKVYKSRNSLLPWSKAVVKDVIIL
jgi:Heterokaryon incompatibility protein (HET)